MGGQYLLSRDYLIDRAYTCVGKIFCREADIQKAATTATANSSYLLRYQVHLLL
jgi:hypothetical protein